MNCRLNTGWRQGRFHWGRRHPYRRKSSSHKSCPHWLARADSHTLDSRSPAYTDCGHRNRIVGNVDWSCLVIRRSLLPQRPAWASHRRNSPFVRLPNRAKALSTAFEVVRSYQDLRSSPMPPQPDAPASSTTRDRRPTSWLQTRQNSAWSSSDAPRQCSVSVQTKQSHAARPVRWRGDVGLFAVSERNWRGLWAR